MSEFRCGNDPSVYMTLTPEARAELQEFAAYLKEVARRRKAKEPKLAGFEEWRNQRQADGA